MKEKRLSQILAVLEANKRVSVAKLVELLSVSDMTIRRDLQELEKRGALCRYHGGAYLMQEKEPEDDEQQEAAAPDSRRQAKKMQAAALGCRYLTRLLENQAVSSVTFGSGTTIHAMVRMIDFAIPVSVITGNLKTAAVLSRNGDNTVIMLGGVLNHPEQNAIGYLAEQMLDDLAMDCIFMGTSGIDEMGYVYCYSNFDASILKKMLSAAKRVVVVTDSSKVGKSSLVRVFEMDERFTLITNEDVSTELLQGFQEKGVEIVNER